MTLIYSFFIMQRTGDCDFFAWANNEMTSYETKIMERLKVLDDRRKADSDRLEKLIETKDNDQYVKLRRELELCQTNEKMFQMFWAMIVVVILLLVFLP